MNKDMIEGQWKQIKGTLRQKYGKLTDSDLDQINGNYEKLVGVLQEKYGKSKEDVEKEIKAA